MRIRLTAAADRTLHAKVEVQHADWQHQAPPVGADLTLLSPQQRRHRIGPWYSWRVYHAVYRQVHEVAGAPACTGPLSSGGGGLR